MKSTEQNNVSRTTYLFNCICDLFNFFATSDVDARSLSLREANWSGGVDGAEKWPEREEVNGGGIREERATGGESVAGPCAGFMRAGVGVGAGASGGRCRSSGPADAAITCIVYAKGSA